MPLSQTPLVPVGEVDWSPNRRSEPVSIGIPLPRGAAHTPTVIGIEDGNAQRKPVQVRPLDRWPDGSIRWALVDCLVDTDRGCAEDLVLRLDASPSAAAGDLEVSSSPDGIRIATGAATFGFAKGGAFPLSAAVVAGRQSFDGEGSGLQITHGGQLLECRIADVTVDEGGPLRASVDVRGVLAGEAGRELPLDLFARVEVFAASATVRIAVTIRNRRRASHPEGRWTLGDAGSIVLDAAVLVLTLRGSVDRVQCAGEWGEALAESAQPFEIHQESSGGAYWNGPVHRNRDGRVPLRFRGYRRRDGTIEQTGTRAMPIVVVHTESGSISVAMPQFWQNFPRAIAVGDGRIGLGFFPGESGDVYELQGGEQKTHLAVIAFAADGVSDPPLAWVHDPAIVYPPPEWCCATGAVPWLVPADDEPNRAYLELVQAALDAESGFFAKRERADEFGWRHFGDLPADHESAFQPPGELLVSHYNNQYDAIACFATHFMRTGDRRWWQLMVDLAAHVRDIDLYHTNQDKAAYSEGLFWHTTHYLDAGTSTHRSYPREGQASGGPSAEHNYNVGLMLHYFMTGDPSSRSGAIGLGKWVVAMDDGRRTVFRWLAGGATGLASSTGSPDYHGPGRGGANSILACLVAHRLTADRLFADKADELIRRCIHPGDDIQARNLLDVERRWSYTVFLQVLGLYLDDKLQRGALDDMFFYVRESLLHYARWMVANERPYLDQRDQLEFPNETWPAQDLRKADALGWAAIHAEPAEAKAFLARAAFFRDSSIQMLSATPKHRLTRPLVLVLANGFRFSGTTAIVPYARRETPQGLRQWGSTPSFEPQRVRAFRRARWTAVGGMLAGLVAGVALWWLI